MPLYKFTRRDHMGPKDFHWGFWIWLTVTLYWWVNLFGIVLLSWEGGLLLALFLVPVYTAITVVAYIDCRDKWKKKRL